MIVLTNIESKDWEHLQSKGLASDIKSFDEYEKKLLANAIEVVKRLEASGDYWPTMELLQDIHTQLYHNIHPELAGKLRDDAIVHRIKYDSEQGVMERDAIKMSVREALDSLALEFLKLHERDSNNTSTSNRILEAAAALHRSLVDMRAFEVGGDVAARILLNRHLDFVAKGAQTREIDGQKYNAAMATERLDPLRELLLEACGTSKMLTKQPTSEQLLSGHDIKRTRF